MKLIPVFIGIVIGLQSLIATQDPWIFDAATGKRSPQPGTQMPVTKIIGEEMFYLGQPVSFWMKQFGNAYFNAADQRRVFGEMGIEAVPYIMRSTIVPAPRVGPQIKPPTYQEVWRSYAALHDVVGHEADKELLKMLDDPNTAVRANAMNCMFRMCTNVELSAVAKLRSFQSDPALSHAAGEALFKLGVPQ